MEPPDPEPEPDPDSFFAAGLDSFFSAGFFSDFSELDEPSDPPSFDDGLNAFRERLSVE